MVLPDQMESEDNVNEYVKLRNIEGKVSIKKNCKHDDFEEEKGESINEISTPIENNNEDVKLESDNLDNVTLNTEQESLNDNVDKCDSKAPESDKETENKKKGILKYQRTYSNKHVDFNMDLEFVPFDESKDYTIEIQIVEQMPKKIVSYAALFAQQKKEEDEKLIKEKKEKEKQNRKNKKRKYQEWKKNRNQDKQNQAPFSETGLDSSYPKENNLVENHMNTEDEMDDFSENTYHSDTDIDEHSESISTESESVMHVDDNYPSDQLQEPEVECKTPVEDFNEPSIRTQTGSEIEQMHQDEPMDQKCQNIPIVPEIYKCCENSATSNNDADNQHFACVPAKKQRSNSLSDLEDFKKSHRFVVQRLPRDIELIISRQLEKQYYE